MSVFRSDISDVQLHQLREFSGVCLLVKLAFQCPLRELYSFQVRGLRSSWSEPQVSAAGDLLKRAGKLLKAEARVT